MNERLSKVLAPYKDQKGALIPVLQKTQEELGYLPEEALIEIAHFLRVSRNEVFGVASFYAQFNFEKRGEHTIKVCAGTACHVRGAPLILETVRTELGLKEGQITTDDYKFSLERVACVGSCALAPVMVIDKTVFDRMTPAKTRQVLATYLKEPAKKE